MHHPDGGCAGGSRLFHQAREPRSDCCTYPGRETRRVSPEGAGAVMFIKCMITAMINSGGYSLTPLFLYIFFFFLLL